MTDKPQQASTSGKKFSQILHDLVLANKILVNHGVLDSYGHVSMRWRDLQGEDCFIMSSYRAPALADASDMMIYKTSDGELLNANGTTVGSALERFIHAGLYKGDSRIQAVVHCHTPIFVASSILPQIGKEVSFIRPVLHIAASLGPVTPVYDLRTRLQLDSDLLIKSIALGEDFSKFAQQFPDSRLLLMRGHGATIYSHYDLIDLVSKGVYAKQNAEIQRDAILMNAALPTRDEKVQAIVALEHGEISACPDRVLGAQRSWDLWCRDAMKQEL